MTPAARSAVPHVSGQIAGLLLLAVLLVALLGAAAPALAGFAPGAQGRGLVVDVLDGDTLEVLTSQGSVRVRLWGVDTPEHDQAYGQLATLATLALAGGRMVAFQVRDRDRYGRLVCVVYLPGGPGDGGDMGEGGEIGAEVRDDGAPATCLQTELLVLGAAWVYESYCDTAECASWRELQATARQERRGLWGAGGEPEPPWEFRRRQREHASRPGDLDEPDWSAMVRALRRIVRLLEAFL